MNYQDKTREELIQELKALQQQNKSLKSSFDKDIAEHEQAITAGCNDYIAKPLSKISLIELIKKHF